MTTKWTVLISTRLGKQLTKLPPKVQEAAKSLLIHLEKYGPTAASWPNYGKLKGKKDVYHCHLNKGKPCYVVVWQVIDNELKIQEIRYVGTHEKADYKRLG